MIRRRSGIHRLIETYIDIKESVISDGFGEEVDWQASLDFSAITETDFLREGAWTILSSGMRESIVRNRFPDFSLAFLDWKSARLIVDDADGCKVAALAVFGHARKVGAILELAHAVAELGFPLIKERIDREGVQFLQSFNFVGPVTSYHLAKNLGLDVAKPDRHLCRVAEACGYSSPHDFCKAISLHTGDRIAVVDLVIWRFATLQPNYRAWFESRI